MNAFRLAGDMTHLLSVIFLLLKIRTMKSCAGISLKTQELYVVVFIARYLDLFTKFYSSYNTAMKLVFVATSVCIVWYMRFHKVVKQTYDKEQDNFRHYLLIPPCFLLALLVHHAFTVTEILWTFSIYLEAVAILPQLILLQRTKNIDNLTGHYVFLLGAYRSLYLLNWIYRFFVEKVKVRWIPWVSGLVQTALYADFFYYYIKRSALLDGNLMQTKIHNIGATLVGIDKFGNKYYEKLGDMQHGRHRWVEYASKNRYNASQVPPEWHGWLHYITDHTGDQLLLLRPKRYGVEHKENFSGEGDEYIYHSKGHSLNPGQRDWTRYQPWQPKPQ